jgi:methionyl-tRNA synthetase
VAEANGYIDAQAPWTLKKEDPVRMETVLYVLAETIRCLGIIIQPVTPDSAAKIMEQVATPEAERTFAHIAPAFAVKPGTSIPAPQGVFPRIAQEEAA